MHASQTPLHCLKKLKSERRPSRFVVVDIDGDSIFASNYGYAESVFVRLASTYNSAPETFWKFIEDSTCNRSTLWVCGWDMYAFLCQAQFYEYVNTPRIRLPMRHELRLIKGLRKDVGIMTGTFVAEQPPTIIDAIMLKDRKVKFVDLANWGLERSKFPRQELNRPLEQAERALISYVDMIDKLEMGSLSPTAAGQGYTRFRSHDMTCKIVVHQDEDARKLERAAYYGGRCESFKVGTIAGPLYYVDVKGMYSTIAEREMFPTCLEGYEDKDRNMAKTMPGPDVFNIAEVVIEAWEPLYPLRAGGKTYYPVGRFVTSLCQPELIMAYERNEFIGKVRHAWYRSDYVWRDFSQWYQGSLGVLESSNLSHMKGVLKLIVNSTFGKIGARGKTWRDCDADGCPDAWAQFWRTSPEHGGICQGRVINGCHQYLSTDFEPGNSLPSIAATMCSYGRVWLAKLIDQARRRNVVYVDTDGLIVNEEGFRNLDDLIVPVESRFGDLTVRDSGDSAWVGGIKHYRLGDRWVQSGVPKDAKRDKEGRAEWTEHEPFTYSLWHKNPFLPRAYKRTRYGYKPYEHGTVGADGRVSPLRADVREIDGRLRTVLYTPKGEVIA